MKIGEMIASLLKHEAAKKAAKKAMEHSGSIASKAVHPIASGVGWGSGATLVGLLVGRSAHRRND